MTLYNNYAELFIMFQTNLETDVSLVCCCMSEATSLTISLRVLIFRLKKTFCNL